MALELHHRGHRRHPILDVAEVAGREFRRWARNRRTETGHERERERPLRERRTGQEASGGSHNMRGGTGEHGLISQYHEQRVEYKSSNAKGLLRKKKARRFLHKIERLLATEQATNIAVDNYTMFITSPANNPPGQKTCGLTMCGGFGNDTSNFDVGNTFLNRLIIQASALIPEAEMSHILQQGIDTTSGKGSYLSGVPALLGYPEAMPGVKFDILDIRYEITLATSAASTSNPQLVDIYECVPRRSGSLKGVYSAVTLWNTQQGYVCPSASLDSSPYGDLTQPEGATAGTSGKILGDPTAATMNAVPGDTNFGVSPFECKSFCENFKILSKRTLDCQAASGQVTFVEKIGHKYIDSDKFLTPQSLTVFPGYSKCLIFVLKDTLKSSSSAGVQSNLGVYVTQITRWKLRNTGNSHTAAGVLGGAAT